MSINPLVLELLEEATEAGWSAEVACKDRPELLGEIRACLRMLSSVQGELDALFPGPEQAASGRPARPEIPGYVVGEVLGRGGMGVVYKALHVRLNRTVAVKMMLNGGYAGPPEMSRFQREAETLAAIQHPNIVQVHDVGEVDGLLYFTMEFVDGGNLAQKLGGTPQPARDAAMLMVALAGAVEAAHRSGIVHRDLKPANILISSAGTPKITDFGLARRFEAGIGLSMTGLRVGTPGYMAPEQVAGHARVSGSAMDVYALGAILYEMLTGRPPFLAETAAETERQIVAEEPVSPSRLNAQVPRDLETICMKCLHKEPRKRYLSPAVLEEDLGRFLRGEPILARPVGIFERAGKWARRHPTRTVILCAGLAISIATFVAGWWLLSERSLATHDIENDLLVAKKAFRRSDWGESRSALERARGRLGPADYGGLRRRVDEAVRDYELGGKLAAIRVNRISQSKGGAAHWADEYEQVFHSAGLLDMDESPELVAHRLAGSDIKYALVAGIDDWALCANYVTHSPPGEWPSGIPRDREAWLLDVARHADPDPLGWRDRFRNASAWGDKKKLAELADSASIAETPVHLLVSLGELYHKTGGDAAPFLLAVQRCHPDDLWTNYMLGEHSADRHDMPEALRNFQAALAARPEAGFLHHRLGQALGRVGRKAESLAYHRKAVEFDPDDHVLRWDLGNRLMDAGQFREAIDQFERGIVLTRDATQQSWFRKAIQNCHAGLGNLKALDEAWKRSLEANPLDYEDWDGYAEFCLDQGRMDDYRSTCLQLVERFGNTRDSRVAERLGRVLVLAPCTVEMSSRASAILDVALADLDSKPEWLRPYFQFAKGLAEFRQGRPESAIKIMGGPARNALQSAPGMVAAMAHHRLGHREEALKTFATAILLTDWRKPPANDREKSIYHILRREAESMLLPDLPAFLAGTYWPRTKDEKIGFLGVCQFEGRERASAELYREILASDSQLANDLQAGLRYRAACSAALAGSGRGNDGGGMDDAAQLLWRTQARDWLRADLASIETLAKSRDPQQGEFLKSTLNRWSTDPDLAGLRDPALPSAEQEEFQMLCEKLKVLVEKNEALIRHSSNLEERFKPRFRARRSRIRLAGAAWTAVDGATPVPGASGRGSRRGGRA